MRPWLLLPVLLLPPAPAPGRTLTQVQGPATAALTGARVGKDGLEVHLSGEARLVLEVQGRAPLRVEVPAAPVREGAWRCRPAGPPELSPPADGRQRWRQSFDLEPLQKGRHDVVLAPLTLREGDGPPRELSWKPLPVVVTTGVARADVGEARDITPIEQVPPAPAWPAWVLAVPAALAAVGLLAGLWLVRRRRLPRALALPPDRAALRALEQAAALPLTTPAEVERYHTRLSDVVRRYLEARFALPASRQTTAEFLEAMRRSPHLTAGQQELLRDFLARCDLGKFAPVTPPAEECRTSLALARTFVEQTGAPLPGGQARPGAG